MTSYPQSWAWPESAILVIFVESWTPSSRDEFGLQENRARQQSWTKFSAEENRGSSAVIDIDFILRQGVRVDFIGGVKEVPNGVGISLRTRLQLLQALQIWQPIAGAEKLLLSFRQA